MEMLSIEKELKENSYPGRGIIIGTSPQTEESCNCLLYYGKK